MAEKAHHFQDLRAEELITSSPGPSAHKRTGRGVRNFDNAVLRPRSLRRRSRRQRCQVLTEPDHKTPHPERLHKPFG